MFAAAMISVLFAPVNAENFQVIHRKEIKFKDRDKEVTVKLTKLWNL